MKFLLNISLIAISILSFPKDVFCSHETDEEEEMDKVLRAGSHSMDDGALRLAEEESLRRRQALEAEARRTEAELASALRSLGITQADFDQQLDAALRSHGLDISAFDSQRAAFIKYIISAAPPVETPSDAEIATAPQVAPVETPSEEESSDAENAAVPPAQPVVGSAIMADEEEPALAAGSDVPVILKAEVDDETRSLLSPGSEISNMRRVLGDPATDPHANDGPMRPLADKLKIIFDKHIGDEQLLPAEQARLKIYEYAQGMEFMPPEIRPTWKELLDWRYGHGDMAEERFTNLERIVVWAAERDILDKAYIVTNYEPQNESASAVYNPLYAMSANAVTTALGLPLE